MVYLLASRQKTDGTLNTGWLGPRRWHRRPPPPSPHKAQSACCLWMKIAPGKLRSPPDNLQQNSRAKSLGFTGINVCVFFPDLHTFKSTLCFWSVLACISGTWGTFNSNFFLAVGRNPSPPKKDSVLNSQSLRNLSQPEVDVSEAKERPKP